ncbi:MAG: TIGR03560 family F420-dependent LLM class oxidoreductase [Chloroflexota bacterium]|nr:TIGR03560 family F420-dependent LLM class oxidoreductase [Chloroflexota bacterium]
MSERDPGEAHFGANLPAQHTSWEALRDAGTFADEAGFDSIWTWDHFVPLSGDTSGAMFEAWMLLAAWGALTRRAKLGTLVTGNTYRHPAVLANMVATLDHVTNGRAILGLGAAWHEAEHAMYGIPFFTPGTRLARMDEAAALIRGLLDDARVSFAGKHYTLRDALREPKPVQRRLPILIGGGGERKTLRTVARYADYWHGHGPPEVIAHKLAVLRAHCADVGRDPTEITPLTTVSPQVVLRDSVREVEEWWREVAKVHGMAEAPAANPIHTVDALVARLLELWRAGARGFIFYYIAPFDRRTMRLVCDEVRPRFAAALRTEADAVA